MKRRLKYLSINYNVAHIRDVPYYNVDSVVKFYRMQ